LLSDPSSIFRQELQEAACKEPAASAKVLVPQAVTLLSSTVDKAFFDVAICVHDIADIMSAHNARGASSESGSSSGIASPLELYQEFPTKLM